MLVTCSYCKARYSIAADRLRDMGGLGSVERMNERKAGLVYECIDKSDGFYRGTADKGSRSLMNATLRLESEALEDRFVDESLDAGFVGLRGHRSAGGVRISLYNAVSLETVEELLKFMNDFQSKYG